ncbi:hypothetical protein A2688_02155 [Candidatus Daviesbacteria bacterium RIFCSPHIGHO2_01_FULL_38_8]|nr:MAG: hypothetical protein A2688_02155 [Candidatus Daviesbacteria bacterium RIFCSPHIGHO2_01_FULL_38_8]
MSDDSSDISSLHRQAIDAALNCNWEKAIELNKQIIELSPDDIASLNRLAKAYFEIGKYKDSKKTYESVLKIDPYNPIAQKNIKRLSSFKQDNVTIPTNGSDPRKLSASIFLQEPGTTKIVNLIKVAEPQKLSLLSSGTPVNIMPKTRGISITGDKNTYLGALPDDISHHLLRLIRGGNKYQAIIKSVKSNGLTIMIKEVFRSKRFKNQPSFLDESYVATLSSDHLPLNIEGSGMESSESEEG